MQIDHMTRRTLVRSALLAGALAIGVGTIGLERARAFGAAEEAHGGL
jgi:hypothetical protein